MSVRYLFLTSLVLLLTLSGCSKDEPSVSAPENNKTEKSCKSEHDYSIAPEVDLQFHEVELVRVHQEVQRLDCSGTEISKKVEEVKAPKKTIEIQARRFLKVEDRKLRREVLNSMTFRARNRQTCQMAQRDLAEAILAAPIEGVFTALSDSIGGDVPHHPSFKITLDYAPALFTTEVNTGIQLIDYEFKKPCKGERRRIKESRRRNETIPPESVCYKPFERGTAVFAIKYRNKTRKGTKVVRAAGCNKK